MPRLVALLLAAVMAFAAAPAGAAAPAPDPPPPADGDCDQGHEGQPVSGPVVAAAGAPIGLGSCAGVRPGARIIVDGSAGCSLNFRFTGRDAQGRASLFMGTAGHCAFGSGVEPPVQQVWAPGQGPLVTDESGKPIGRIAYAIFAGERDFGLVHLDPGVRSSAEMCHFGGPTGLNRERTASPTTLHYYGQGMGLGKVVPARSAVALGMPQEGHVQAVGVVVPGDSGAGVVSADGRAVGLVTTVGVRAGQIGTAGNDVGTVGVVRLDPVLKRATTALRQRLSLHRVPR